MRKKRIARWVSAAVVVTVLMSSAIQEIKHAPAQAGTITSGLEINNPFFKNNGQGWTFTSGTGVSNNHNVIGRYNAFLDRGTGHKVSQTITASTSGKYTFRAWISTESSSGGSFTVQTPSGVANTALGAASNTQTYQLYSISGVYVAAGETVTVAFSSSPNGWINVQAVNVSPSADEFVATVDGSSEDAQTLRELIQWSQKKAGSWRQPQGLVGVLNANESNYAAGDSTTGTYFDSYWAGYPARSAFYLRDTVHQVVGAQLIGLNDANFNMLRQFAKTSNDNRNGSYDPLWGLNFDGSPFTLDYTSDQLYIHEIPGTFELVQRIYDAYRWSGDTRYLTDPEITSFVARLNEYVDLHAPTVTTPKFATGNGSLYGGMSYNEGGLHGRSNTLATSGDLIGSQYQAYLAAAQLSIASGDLSKGQLYNQTAQQMRDWVNSNTPICYNGDGLNTNGTSYNDVWNRYLTQGDLIGNEPSWLLFLKNIVKPGICASNFLRNIDNKDAAPNIEATTYVPEVFFANNVKWSDSYSSWDAAWKWMKTIFAKRDTLHSGGPGTYVNGDYPEVSFTLLSQVVNGLAGVSPGGDNSLETVSRLPSTIDGISLPNIPLWDGTVSVAHKSKVETSVTNNTSRTMIWRPSFPSSAGVAMAAEVSKGSSTSNTTLRAEFNTVDGGFYLKTEVVLAPGESAKVKISQLKSTQVKTPTVTEQYCDANQNTVKPTVTVPSAEGIRYSVAGTLAAGNTIVVTATPLDTYSLQRPLPAGWDAKSPDQATWTYTFKAAITCENGLIVVPPSFVSVSSSLDSSKGGSFAIDGDFTTEWVSYHSITPWIQLDWLQEQYLGSVTFRDRTSATSWARGGSIILFSQGLWTEIPVSGIPNDGSPYTVYFPPQYVSALKFEIWDSVGTDIGLTEVSAHPGD